MKKLLSILILVLVLATTIQAQPPMSQDSRMAERYYANGEYEKAAVHYKKLYNDKDGVTFFYVKYFETLLKLEDYDELETMINKAYKQSRGDVKYLVDLGYINNLKGDEKASIKYYDEAIEKVQPQQYVISTLARQFMGYNQIKYSEKAYLKGKAVLNDASLFNLELAYVYSLLSDYQNMISSYLEELYIRPERLRTVQSNLQRYLEEEQYDIFEATLLKRVQREPNVLVYQELLIWLYMNVNDFESAFIQARSLDIKFGGNGRRILDLARTATQQEQYDMAIKAYQYLIDKGPELEVYVTASIELINVKRDKVVNSPYYTQKDLVSLEASYNQFIQQHQQEYTTGFAIIELAKLEAFYIHDIDTAISVLNNLLETPRLNKEIEGKAKINLGDYYLLRDEHWESVLLYGQVEKAFRGSPMAEEAKLRNAKLSYYKGDFEWAKTQLDILKSSTSELISNDAIELSVFIADNLNLDTTDHPMYLFANSELKIYQNYLNDAQYELDGILKLYPNHSLTDDVYFKKAEIAIKKQEYEKAAEWLNKITDEFSEDLLADNALYLLGDLYLNYLKDEEKAKATYEKLILEHQGSTFIVDARKIYRKLRGDVLN